MKKILFWGIIVVLCVAALTVLSLAVYVQTSGFKSWLKDVMIAQAQPWIDGELAVETLDGDLFSRIELRGIHLTRNRESIIRIERIAAWYDLTALLSRRIAVSLVVLDAPEITLRRQEDRSWNIATVYRAAEAPDDTVSSSSGWGMPQPRVLVRNGSLILDGLNMEDPRLPERLNDINLDLSYAYQEGRSVVLLDSLRLMVRNPDMRIGLRHARVAIDDTTLAIEELSLHTGGSRITADLDVKGQQHPELTLSLSASPLALDDLRRFLPDLPVYGNTDLEFEATGTPDDLTAILALGGDFGQIEATARLNLTAPTMTYDVTGRIRRGNPAPLLRQKELMGDYNADFNIQGQDVEWGKIRADVTLDVKSATAMGHRLDASVIRAAIRGDSLALDGALASKGASTTLGGTVLLRAPLPVYTVEGDFRNIDLARFVPDGAITSALSGRYRIDGRGMDAAHVSSAVMLTLTPSHIDSIPIDSLRMIAEIDPDRILLQEFLIASPIAAVEAQGSRASDASVTGSFRIELKDLTPFASMAALDTLAGRIDVSGALEGRLDSLILNASFNAADLVVPNVYVPRLNGRFTGRKTAEEVAWTLDAMVHDALISEQDSLDAVFTLSCIDSVIDFHTDFIHPAVAVETGGRLALRQDGYQAVLEQFDINHAGMRWIAHGPPAEIRYNGAALDLSDFTLASDGQAVTLTGHADTSGTGVIRIKIDSLRLATILALNGTPDSSYAGVFDGVFTIQGPFAEPVVEGRFRLTESRIQQQKIHQISGDLNLKDRRLDWRVHTAVLGQDSLLTATGYLPVKFGLSPFVFAIPDDESLDLALRMADLDMAIMNGLVDDVTDIRGNLSANFRLYNTIKDLHGIGSIGISNGAWSMASLGTKYRDVRLGLLLRENEALLETFNVNAGRKGSISISDGSISLSQQTVDHFNARLIASKFPLMNNRKMRALVDGQLTISGSVREPSVSGTLTIPEARVYYPAWMEEDTAVLLTDKPFFVIDTDTVPAAAPGAARFQQSKSVERPLTETDLYRNLQGNITLNFNRNTWLRSEEASIEIEGTLRVQKDRGRDLVLFGTLSTVRGYYELQGNRFHIVEGRLIFKGDPEINPDVRLEAVYNYVKRTGDETTKHEIRIFITGDTFTPQMVFTLDGQPAEQQDIFSILLFGKSFNELAIGQQGQIAEESGAGQTATRFLSGQVVKRIARQLEKQLKLDMLQIDQGEGGFKNTRVQAGKYLASGVFLSVTQDLGSEGDQRVEMEYKIPRSLVFLDLFLRALKEKTGSSGVDLIWKLEW